MTPDGCDPQTHHLGQVPAIVVKTKPVDMDEGPESLSSPIVILSSKNKNFSLKAKPLKGKDIPLSLTKQDFINAKKATSSLVKLMPCGKGKEVAAGTREPVLDLPSSNQLEPLSETMVYLKDMWVFLRSGFPQLILALHSHLLSKSPLLCRSVRQCKWACCLLAHLLHVGEDGSASPLNLWMERLNFLKVSHWSVFIIVVVYTLSGSVIHSYPYSSIESALIWRALSLC